MTLQRVMGLNTRGSRTQCFCVSGGVVKGLDLRVLVVEDEPALRRLIALTLTDAGIDVNTAEHGRAALDVSALSPPDAVVLDLEMPVMDGRACFRALRALGIQAPVLILSAHGAREAASELGAQAAMDKPFDASDLVHHLMSAVV